MDAAFVSVKALLLSAVALVAASGVKAASLDATFRPKENRLQIQLEDVRPGAHEIRIITPGIQKLESSSDVRETGTIYLPPPDPAEALPDNAELFFFFHDAPHDEDWELVLTFADGIDGNWILNGREASVEGNLRREVVIPVTALLQGENLFFFRSDDRRLPRLYYRRVVEPDTQTLALEVTRGDWSAEVSLWARANAGEAGALASVQVEPPPVRHERQPPPGPRAWENRALIEEAALAVGRNLLNARVKDPHSRFVDGFHLVYDRTRSAHRISHWLWSWGPAVKLLFDLEAHAEAAGQAALADEFRSAAIAAARRSLAFEMTESGHPAEGVSRVRWEISRNTPDGWVEYLSTADSLFLAGWGWMSAYQKTGDSIFLERMQGLAAAAVRLMDAYPVVPQDWIVERARWTPHTLDESVFGMIGFRELHEATGDPAVARAGQRFLDSHLEHMARGGGLLERAWLREEDRAIWDPDIKGHAWVVEGYLDAYHLSGDEKYLELARTLAAKVMASQREDGSWSYLFTPPNLEEPADDKGTSIWAYFFYVLHETTRDPAHLAAARHALDWCLQNQYRGDDPRLDGALLTDNGMSYVQKRPLTILYSTTFFGLGLLEELKQ